MALRSRGVAPVTFFMFQDMITCVLGIMILVTLQMASQVDPVAQRDQEPGRGLSSDPESELSWILKEVVELRMKIRALEQMRAGVALPSLTALKAEVDRLLGRIAWLEAAIENKDKAARAAAEDEANRNKPLIVDLRRKIEELRRDIAKLQEAMLKALEERDKLGKEAAPSSTSGGSGLGGKFWVVEGGGGKTPLLVVVSQQGIVLQRFRHPEAERKLDAPVRSADFREVLKSYATSDFYVVFYVKPSGVEIFRRLEKATSDAGFDTGYDALEEGTELRFLEDPKP